MIAITETGGGISFSIRVHPCARKNAITGEVGNALKLSLTSPPVDGRANEACVAFFAEILKVPRSSITIAAGQSSRNKVVRVQGITVAQGHERLCAATR